MKKITLTLLGLGLFSSLFALDATDIETKIQEIQKLPPQERVEKMNELKMEIRALNEKEREKIIEPLARTHKISTEKSQEVQTHMKTKVETHKVQMEHNIHHKERIEMEHNIHHKERIEIEHKMDNIEHNSKEIEHKMDNIEHNSKEIEHNRPNIDKIEINK